MTTRVLPNSESHVKCALDGLPHGSSLYLAPSQSTDTAIVFVHGHHGSPVETWNDFASLIDSAQTNLGWAQADVYFFGYDDFGSIDDASSFLQHFLTDIYPLPQGYVESAVLRLGGASRSYRKLILVGHSEGGVVLRSCLAELGKELARSGIKSPILDARLVLFAPALFGFVPTGWLGVLAKVTGIRQIVDLYVASSVAATEMREGTVLQQVREDTEKLFDDHPQVSAFTAHVVFGSDENVVVRSRYFQDYKIPTVVGKDHVTICKPTNTYQLPLFLVKGEL